MPVIYDDDDEYPDDEAIQAYIEGISNSEPEKGTTASGIASLTVPPLHLMTGRLSLESTYQPSMISSTSAAGIKRAVPPVSPSNPAKVRKTSSFGRTGSNASLGARSSREVQNPENSLDPFFVAHCPRVQELLNKKELAWGTVFELARGVTNGSWDWSMVTEERLSQLQGTNAEAAHRVAAVMVGRQVPVTLAAAELWAEYDREQAAILENKGRGLGGMGAWHGKDDWYGGRIQQVGRVKKGEKKGPLVIHLEKPEIRRSHRFSRYLGSRRILQVRVSDELLYQQGNGVRDLFSTSKFILCGRVFIPFHAKEGSVYMVETAQDYGRECSQVEGDQHRLSFGDFINWHNPFRLNSGQPISKWSTRWALGVSTSVPTIQFDSNNIYFINDEYVTPADWGSGKPPAEKTYTDGCGWINGAALTQIMRIMKHASRPTAVQGRIGGSKGMWVLHPDPNEQVADGCFKIWIRDSQKKISLSHSLPVSQRIFELLAPSRVSQPSRLSAQALVNIAHNGVPHGIIKKLMAEGLSAEVQELTEWSQPDSMLMVWRAVEKAGQVILHHIRRKNAGELRAMGLGDMRPLDKQDEEGEGEDEDEGFEETSFSGSPVKIHESILELLQAGFHPLKLKLLYEKLEKVLIFVLDAYVREFHIPVMESLTAYIVPDPYGVLNENEIHFRSAEPFVDPVTGIKIDTILGEVLVWRNPTRLPSDIQKVTAVSHPKLSNYYNVIIFPIKGKFTLASYLGGGDYDGDTVVLTWDKELVQNFKNPARVEEPKMLKDAFEREVENVKDFDKRISSLPVKEAQQALQSILILGLAETRVGLYSKFHDLAIYKKGYDSEEAIQLAYMFTTCLDASKTGLRVKKDVFERDRKAWGSEKPWYVWVFEKDKNGKKEGKCIQRNGFILDALVKHGHQLKEEFLRVYKKLWEGKDDEGVDGDLTRPWRVATERARQAYGAGLMGFANNLKVIEGHVDKSHEAYKRAACRSSSGDDEYTPVARGFAQQPDFEGFQFFSDEDVQLIKASYATVKSLPFAFTVAFKDLCTIKARAVGSVPFTNQFAQSMSVSRTVVRSLARSITSIEN